MSQPFAVKLSIGLIALLVLAAVLPNLFQHESWPTLPKPLPKIQEPVAKLTNAVQPIRTLPTVGYVYALALSPDGKTLVTSEDSGSPITFGARRSYGLPRQKPTRTIALKLWNFATGKPRRTTALPQPVSSLAISPDGQTLVTATQLVDADDPHGGNLQWWSLQTGALIRTLSKGNSGRYVQFSSDGKFLANDDRDGVKLWSLPEGKPVRTLKPQRLLFGLAFVDGQALAIADSHVNETGAIQLWNWRTGKLIQTIQDARNFDGRVLAASSQARSIATGYQIYTGKENGGEIRVWNSSTGKRRLTFRQADPVNVVAFSPDGRLLASAKERTSSEATSLVALWNLQTGQLIRNLPEVNSVDSISFSPDSKLLITGGYKEIKVWRVDQLLAQK